MRALLALLVLFFILAGLIIADFRSHDDTTDQDTLAKDLPPAPSVPLRKTDPARMAELQRIMHLGARAN